jgi:peptidoglycan/LPS O-acetylase OafA/YrhL
MGACLAFLFRSPRFMASIQKYRRVLLAVLLWLLLGAALVTFHSQGLDAFRLQFWLALLFSTLLLVALVNRDGRLGSILRSRILVWLGTLSFGIYMLHQAVSGLVHGLLRGDAPAIASWSDAGVTALALTLTLALAALSYRFLESPLLAAGHRLRFVDGQRLPVETGKDLDVLHRAAAER